MTRSPSAIIPKSAMALPAALRSCASSFLKLLEMRRSGRAAPDGALIERPSRRFQVFGFEIAQVRRCGERLAGRPLDELLDGQARTDAVHVLAQPVHHAAELAGGDLRVERGSLGTQCLVDLSRDHGAERVGGEISEMTDRPVNVLQ